MTDVRPILPELVSTLDDGVTPEAATRAAAALRRLARREDLKDAVLRSPHLYPVLRQAAARYVAGETLDEALATAQSTARLGHLVTIDHMGEDTRDEQAARVATEEFLALVQALGPASGADAHSVSLDLSHIGLAVTDAGTRLATDNLQTIAAAADALGREVIISMEGSERTQAILDIHATVAKRYPRVGVTLQAGMLRTHRDLDALLKRPGRIRLVKGAYAEGASIAHGRGAQLDASYAQLATRLIDAGAAGRTCSIATHDAFLLSHVDATVRERGGRAAEAVQIEMLHGIQGARLQAMHARGFTTRVYLVYGREWWLYLCHRLAEHPASVLDALCAAVEAMADVSTRDASTRLVGASARPGRA